MLPTTDSAGHEAHSSPPVTQPQPTTLPPPTTKPSATQPTPTPTPFTTPAAPTTELEPTPDLLEHTSEQLPLSPPQDSTIPQSLSPTHSPTTGNLNVEYLIQLVPQLISRIDGLEKELRDTK
ncbi:hypothetical protein Tco_1371640 [Tanacetum coccineum]